MIIFGFLADKYGRKSIYGLELLIVILATIGLTQSSAGYNSMDPYGWIGFWRCVQGIGLGAEYPLSAIMAAEWSSARTRGRMMASVFLCQAVAQAVANVVCLAVLYGLSPRLGLLRTTSDPEVARRAIDAVWRTIIGVGAIPALLAFILRRLLPESPRWLAETSTAIASAQAAAQGYNVAASPMTASHPPGSQLDVMAVHQNPPVHVNPIVDTRKNPWWKKMWNAVSTYLADIIQYLSENSRWRCLCGVVFTWYLLDLCKSSLQV
jgi:PHS family inorganic phosphate transporter-like MFS transporter